MSYSPSSIQNPELQPYIQAADSQAIPFAANAANQPAGSSGGINSAIAAMNAQTIAQVGNVLGGLPTVSSMANGAYGFAGGIISSADAAQAANTALENTFVTTNVSTLTPIMAAMARMVGRNQSASITAASSAGGGGKK